MIVLQRTIASLNNSVKELITSSPIYRRTALISFIFLLSSWLLPFWRIAPLGQERQFIPLHYNIYFGIDRFGPWEHIFLLPAIGLLLFIVNLIFQSVFLRTEHILSYFFAFSTVLAEIILFAAVVAIVLLNL